MEKKEKVYIVIIMILVLALGITIGVGIKANLNTSNDQKETNKNTNNNSENNNKEENKKEENKKEEITDSLKKELANIVGLTEKGLERLTAEQDKDKAATGNYADITGFTHLETLINLGKDKEIVIKDLPAEDIKHIVFTYAINNNMLEKDLTKCPADYVTGQCSGVSIANYKKIAEKYNLSQNIETYFEKDNIVDGYYIYPGTGTTGSYAKIEDSMNFERKDNDIILTYKIKIDYEGAGPKNTDEKVTFTFKKSDKGSYYLHSVKTVNA